MTTASETQPPDDSTRPENRGEGSAASWKRSAFVSAIILLAALGLALLTFFTEPTAERSGATKKTAMLVEVVTVERGTYRPNIVATGTVEPARDIVLRSQVQGRILEHAEEFTPGGFVEKGETLVRVESADYKYIVAQRKSELSQALSDLAVEKGRQDVAEADYAYLGEDLPAEQRARVLRKPQLEAARDRVEAARAAVEQAELDLRRTSVEAPFSAHVLRRDVNVGSRISPDDSLGRLVGIEKYWIAAEVPLSKLRWIALPSEGVQGSEVQIRNHTSWPSDAYRTGHVDRLVGALDRTTRMARVLASIPDPLARSEENQGAPALIIGEFVEVSIRGTPIEGVVRLDRDYVRDRDTVWTMEDGKLRVKEVEVVMRDVEHAYIAAGLEDGARVVTTNLSTIVEGAPLRVRDSGGEADAE